MKYECEERNKKKHPIALLARDIIQFPPTVKRDSGETRATKTFSQFSKTFNHSKFQRTLKRI